MSFKRIPLELRFMDKVEKQESGCWRWTSRLDKGGYGQLTLNGKSIRAHRASWTMHNGPIPQGLWVLHKCDHPACVNPEHLFLGTRRDNIDDMVAKGRQQRVCGERHARSKLTPAKIAEMKCMRQEGHTYRTISQAMGVHPTTASKVVSGLSWGHLS